METIKIQKSNTSSSIFELITATKRSNWNNRRRYSNATQFKFI